MALSRGQPGASCVIREETDRARTVRDGDPEKKGRHKRQLSRSPARRRGWGTPSDVNPHGPDGPFAAPGWSVASKDGVRFAARTGFSCSGSPGHFLHPRHGRDAGRSSGVLRYRRVRTTVLPAFDPETYIDKVLRPLGRGGSGSLPHLVVRYALDQSPLDAADREIMKRVDQVVDLWRRQEEGGTAGLAEACRRCLVEDDRLRDEAAYRDPRWWRGRIRDWQGLGPPDDAGPESASRPWARRNSRRSRPSQMSRPNYRRRPI